MVLIADNYIDENVKELGLKIESRGSEYFFYFSRDGKNWIYITKARMDAKFLSTKTAGGFVGSMYALYATSLGIESNSKVYFNWFESKSNDDLYK